MADVAATTPAGTPVTVRPDTSDPAGHPLTLVADQPPAHGTVAVDGTAVTYTPAAGFSGTDTFTVKSTNGTLSSDPATITITVTPAVVNHAPVAGAQAVTAVAGQPLPITLTGTDPDGDNLAYTVLTAPVHGTLSGTAPNLTYTPAPGFQGPDSLTFKVNDGKVDSPAVTVAITVVQAAGCQAAPKLDTQVSATSGGGRNRVTSLPVTTRGSGELLLAFIGADGPQGRQQRVMTVVGGGLNWTLAARANTGGGTTEVWQAYAKRPLDRMRVTTIFARGGFDSTITVAAYSGTARKLGATGSAASRSGNPAVAVSTTSCNAVVWALGHDLSDAKAPTVSPGQTIVHQFLDGRARTSYWVKRTDNPVPARTRVVFTDSKITRDKWAYVAVEVVPAR
ncbi:Ig-like domain-containing protein [Amycolatopsis tolypomycina]|uniref:Ig-like domain-containing protein n=1 Tax=Amycolatopsis tolypomycina TaxID=208445 RepID=UPI003CC6850F